MKNLNSDQDLVNAAQEGDKRAFGILVLKYQTKLLKLVHRYIHDMNEAKDIVQESFIKAYRAIKDFQGNSNFYTWLYRITVNTVKNYELHSKNQPTNMGIDLEAVEQIQHDPFKNSDNPENCLIRDELEIAVFKAFNALPEDLRNALILRELQGFSYIKIAEMMNCPVGTVRSRISRARILFDGTLKELIDKNKKHS